MPSSSDSSDEHRLSRLIQYRFTPRRLLIYSREVFNNERFSRSAPVLSGPILMLTDSRSEVQTLPGYLRDSFQPIGDPAHSSVGLLNAMLRRLSGRSVNKTSSAPLWDTTLPTPQLWDALPGVLRMFLPTSIRAHFMGKNAEVNLKRIVIGNLAGTSSEWKLIHPSMSIS